VYRRKAAYLRARPGGGRVTSGCLVGVPSPPKRQEGTEMLDGLTRHLTVQPARGPGADDFRAAVASEALATCHRRRTTRVLRPGAGAFP
jgi:hypothetical protein